MDWVTLIITLVGGLAIFLYGMTLMTNGLKAAAGSRLKTFLAKMTSNRWKALLAGTGITAIIQSSSVTTVLAVGFVSAGLLPFQNTLGIILGASIGTTITAQIIAFKVTKAALVIVSLGFFVNVAAKSRTYREIGNIVLGLGLVFLGMNLMGEGTEPLKSYPQFITTMKNLDNPFLGILFGAVFTAMVQSSSATTGVVIMLSSKGLVSIEAGIALVIGANIGTCVTAILSALGKPRAAMQVALSHVLFKILGAIIWFFFIPLLAKVVYGVSPNDIGRQVANAHTIFNVIDAFLFIGFTTPFARMITYLVPENPRHDKNETILLDSYYLNHPGLALEMIRQEIGKMGQLVKNIVNDSIEIVVSGNEIALKKLRDRDRQVDTNHIAILRFIQRLEQHEMTPSEATVLRNQIEAANILETVSDIITTDLVEAAEHRIHNGFTVSAETKKKLIDLYRIASDSFGTSLDEIIKPAAERTAINGKPNFKEHLIQARNHLATRLSISDEEQIAKFRFESEVLEVTRRMFSLSVRLYRKKIVIE